MGRPKDREPGGFSTSESSAPSLTLQGLLCATRHSRFCLARRLPFLDPARVGIAPYTPAPRPVSPNSLSTNIRLTIKRLVPFLEKQFKSRPSFTLTQRIDREAEWGGEAIREVWGRWRWVRSGGEDGRSSFCGSQKRCGNAGKGQRCGALGVEFSKLNTEVEGRSSAL